MPGYFYDAGIVLSDAAPPRLARWLWLGLARYLDLAGLPGFLPRVALVLVSGGHGFGTAEKALVGLG
jgi:hypothetical protein